MDKSMWGFNYSQEIPTYCKLDRKGILFPAITDFFKLIAKLFYMYGQEYHLLLTF